MGFEPTTLGTTNQCSNQLSYNHRLKSGHKDSGIASKIATLTLKKSEILRRNFISVDKSIGSSHGRGKKITNFAAESPNRADVTAYMQPKITITGDLGSGKSVVSKLLQAQLGFEIYSTGKVQREIAARYGMSTLELNQYAENHPEIDKEIDSAFAQLNDRPEGLIVDSRLAWFFMPNSFRLYLRVPVEIAAQRIMGDPTRKGEQYASLEQAVADISARKQSENRRFLDKYNADCADMRNFDCVTDTNGRSPEAVAAEILAAFAAWKEKQSAIA